MTRRPRETPDYAAAVARMIAAHGRRVAAGDPADLPALLALRDAVDAAAQVAVDGLRERHSWQQIADAVGITRQSAHLRWHTRASR